ncbi:MAG: hypothetical protein NTW97_02975, partial [Candidatus Krumholzibacteria bacterium]|nr:hypothetical protein [Candidatus Krumholzibacteria bacterium]
LTFSLVEILSVTNVRSGSVAAYENRYQLPSVMLGVPVRKGLVLGIGYQTEFIGKGDFSFDSPIDSTATAHETYRHRSGLFDVPLSIAWRPVSWARVAGAYRLERGSIKDDYRVDYYSSVESKRMRSFSGDSWSGSVILNVHPRLSLGLGWKSAIAYEGEETFKYSRAEFDSVAAWRFKVPYSWDVGAACGISEQWWLSAHFWRRGAPETRGFEQLAGSIGEERLVALGVEKRSGRAGGLFTRIPLRLGFYENRWHFEYPAGRPVKSRFVTFGTAFDLPGGPGAIDLSFEIGQIGSVADNGMDERVFRMAFGLSASETWSKRKTER